VIATGGGVTLVLVDGGAHPIVARFLERHGPGVGHIAIDVLNAQFTHDALAANGTPLLTDVVVDADGHEGFPPPAALALNHQFTHHALAPRGPPLRTDVVVDADAYEEFLAAVDLVSGLQLAF